MTKIYRCDACSYTTLDSKNYKKHIKTDKHTKNTAIFEKQFSVDTETSTQTKRQFTCENCLKNYSSKQYLFIHMKSCEKTEKCNKKQNTIVCEEKHEELEEQEELKKQIDELKKTILEKDKIIKKKEKDIKHARKIIDKSVENINSVLAITNFLNINSRTGPYLTYEDAMENKLKIKDKQHAKEEEEYIELTDSEDLFIEDIYYHSKNNSVVQYLSDILISQYKKENVHDQALYTSDCQRMTYIIAQEKEKTEREWATDLQGEKMCGIIIKPLLSKIKNRLDIELSGIRKKYFTPKGDKNEEFEGGEEEIHIPRTVLRKQELFINLIKKINEGELEKEIKKNITPQFKFIREKFQTNNTNNTSSTSPTKKLNTKEIEELIE